MPPNTPISNVVLCITLLKYQKRDGYCGHEGLSVVRTLNILSIGETMSLIRTLLTAFLLMPNSALADQESEIIKGVMTCKVTEQKVLGSDVPSNYDGSQTFAGFKVGDQLAFEYGYQYQPRMLYVDLSIRDKTRMSMYLGDDDTFKARPGSLTVRSSLPQTKVPNTGFIQMSGDSWIEVAENISAQHLVLDRYAESNWEGLFVEGAGVLDMKATVAAFDCRTGTDAVKEIIKAACIERFDEATCK